MGRGHNLKKKKYLKFESILKSLITKFKQYNKFILIVTI